MGRIAMRAAALFGGAALVAEPLVLVADGRVGASTRRTGAGPLAGSARGERVV